MVENITKIYNNEYSLIHPNWLKYFNTFESQDFMNILKDFIINTYLNNNVVYPALTDLFNPFKYTDPFKIKVVMLNQSCENHSLGLAFSSKTPSKACLAIEQELKREFNEQYNRDISISDPSFKKLSSQGVFMPCIHLFYGIGQIPQCIEMFWNSIFKLLVDLGNIIWFAWGDNERYINKLLNIENEDNMNKKKPDDKIIVNTNVKLRDNAPGGRNFKGNGCFCICNHYLKQFHREPIDWMHI
jgi:uracil DNA glycosylase